MKLRLCSALTLVGALFLMAAPQAEAVFQVTLSAGGASTTIEDGGPGDDDSALDGQITVIEETVGGYSFQFQIVTSNTPGAPAIAFVNSSMARVQNVSGGTTATTVSIYANATGFTAPTTPPPLEALTAGSISYLTQTPDGTTADPVKIESRVDTTNGTSTTPTGTVVGLDEDEEITSGGADSTAALSDVRIVSTLASPYALNLLLSADLLSPHERPSGGTSLSPQSTLVLDGGVQLTPDPTAIIPEPSTLAVGLAAGLPLLGISYLRRRRARA